MVDVVSFLQATNKPMRQVDKMIFA